MATYTASTGDSIPSIAMDTGFFWKTIWNHGNNANLKSKRKNPNVIFQGDEVFIPDLETKTVSKPTEQRHKFVRKGEPVKIVIKLMKNGKPRANEAYVFTINGKDIKGNTDGDGVIKQFIPGDASGAILSMQNGKEIIPLQIGALDPVDEITGVQQRLSNLGYDCEVSGELDDATERALTSFQAEYQLDASGKIDDATKNKLLDLTQ